MKLLTATTLSLFILIKTVAQPVIPAYGKIDKADLELKTCDLEQNAEAMVLFDIGEFYCDLHPGMMNPIMILNEKRIRIKTLNDKGLENANVHIKYHSFRNDETVKDI